MNWAKEFDWENIVINYEYKENVQSGQDPD